MYVTKVAAAYLTIRCAINTAARRFFKPVAAADFVSARTSTWYD